MWTSIVVAAVVLVAWSSYRSIRRSRDQRPPTISPEAFRNRVEAGMVMGRSWSSPSRRY